MSQKPTYTPATKLYVPEILTDAEKTVTKPTQSKLYKSSVETCNNSTNVNNGLTGVPLSMYGYRYHSD
ncbi:unnamed protein product [Brassica oleracea var. botrytis]